MGFDIFDRCNSGGCDRLRCSGRCCGYNSEDIVLRIPDFVRDLAVYRAQIASSITLKKQVTISRIATCYYTYRSCKLSCPLHMTLLHFEHIQTQLLRLLLECDKKLRPVPEPGFAYYIHSFSRNMTALHGPSLWFTPDVMGAAVAIKPLLTFAGSECFKWPRVEASVCHAAEQCLDFSSKRLPEQVDIVLNRRLFHRPTRFHFW